MAEFNITGYGKGRRECRYGCCFEDPFSKTLPQLDNRYKNPCWYETQFDPEVSIGLLNQKDLPQLVAIPCLN